MKKVAIFFASIMMLSAVYVLPAMAQTNTDPFGISYGANTGLGNADPRDIIANVIRVGMGFLGTIAVIIILIGGFKWMTAGGNDTKVGEAKKYIMYGIVGLIIVLSAYAITTFVLSSLVNATR